MGIYPIKRTGIEGIEHKVLRRIFGLRLIELGNGKIKY
jgi:hypothetical protein